MNRQAVFTRFQDAPWFEKDLNVTVGGAGGIGSWLTILLSRMPYNIYLFDFDIIEEHNLGGQLYGANDIGKNKANCIRERAMDLSSSTTVYPFGEFTPESPIADIAFTCFDNMKGRKLMYDKWKNIQLSKDKAYKEAHPNEINIFIDGRMSAETGMIYFLNSKSDLDKYEAELFTDEQVPAEQCSFRATSHCGAMIASYMIAGLNNHITNKKEKMELRTVPYKIEFELPFLMNEVKI